MAKITLLLEQEVLNKVELIAKQQGRSKSAVIRDALWEYIVEREEMAVPTNPLLALIGLAGDSAVPTDIGRECAEARSGSRVIPTQEESPSGFVGQATGIPPASE